MIFLVIGIIYIIVGCILGSVFSLLFFRMDEGWKKVGTFIFGAGSSGGIYLMLNNMCGLVNGNTQVYFLALLLLCITVSAIVIFKILCGLLKGQDGANIIRILDIVLGQKNFIDNYYATRKREIDSQLNYDEIVEKNAKLEQKEEWLRTYEENLSERAKNLEEQLQEAVCLALPEKQKIPLTNHIISEFPEFVEMYAAFISDLRQHTNNFVAELKNVQGNRSDEIIRLEAYFLGICTYIITDLFQGNYSNKVRAHFRILDCKEEYVKLVATTGVDVNVKQLTPIPRSSSNMISRSYKNRASMIKSLNVQYHCNANNDMIWEEYLTYTFDRLFHDDVPFLSFGVSVRNKSKFENLLYFLNFCKIEYVLQDSLEKIMEECDIIDIILSEQFVVEE